MISTALRGLRGRLLLALVLTSAVTLAVAAAVTLGPLQSRLRDESESSLQESVEALRWSSARAMSKGARQGGDKPDAALRGEGRRRAPSAPNDLLDAGLELRDRTNGARVLVADLALARRLRRAARLPHRHRLRSSDHARRC